MVDQQASPHDIERLRARVRHVMNQAHGALNDGGRLLDAGELSSAQGRLLEAAGQLQAAAQLISAG